MDDEKIAQPITSRDTRNRLIQRDETLLSFYTLELEEVTETQMVDHHQVEVHLTIATLSCKYESCAGSWDVTLDSGRCPMGPRNSLISHAQKHSRTYRPQFKRNG